MTRTELQNELIREGYLKTPALIEAFQKIDRADFVPEGERALAYENIALPIGYGSTISQPLTVAFMFEKLQPKMGDKILDIGSGSGWTSTLLAEVVSDKGPAVAEAMAGEQATSDKGQVFGMEIIPELVERARATVDKKYPELAKRITFIAADAFSGLPEKAPFDGIIAAASLAEKIPDAWKDQLAVGGRIVAPVGDAICVVVREPENTYKEEVFPGFVFVPFQHS